MQMGARTWAQQDKVRRRLADCYDGMQREERIRALREAWRAGQLQKRLLQQHGAAADVGC